MGKENIEIKTRYGKHEYARKLLQEKEARETGTDHQIDTYFNVEKGRLKIREGNIENKLIYYERKDKKGPKVSKVTLCELKNPEEVKEVLRKTLGVKSIVDKQRKIYWIENVKVHLDKVKGLGKFLEFELMKDKKGNYRSREDLEELMQEFQVEQEELLNKSYSDMLGE